MNARAHFTQRSSIVHNILKMIFYVFINLLIVVMAQDYDDLDDCFMQNQSPLDLNLRRQLNCDFPAQNPKDFKNYLENQQQLFNPVTGKWQPPYFKRPNKVKMRPRRPKHNKFKNFAHRPIHQKIPPGHWLYNHNFIVNNNNNDDGSGSSSYIVNNNNFNDDYGGYVINSNNILPLNGKNSYVVNNNNNGGGGTSTNCMNDQCTICVNGKCKVCAFGMGRCEVCYRGSCSGINL